MKADSFCSLSSISLHSSRTWFIEIIGIIDIIETIGCPISLTIRLKSLINLMYLI